MLPNGRKVLDRITGDFPHSNLHAIMGPSGSGKSTLISALIGKTDGGAVTGEVVVWREEGAADVASGKDPWASKDAGEGDGHVAVPASTKCAYKDIQ